MPIEKDTANRQWEICPRRGKRKAPQETSREPLSGLARRFVGTASLLTALGSCPQYLARKDFETMVPTSDLEHARTISERAAAARWPGGMPTRRGLSILNRIPHISRLMVNSVDAVLDHGQTIVIGTRDPDFRNVPTRLRDDQVLVDLVRITDDRSRNGNYDGICWYTLEPSADETEPEIYSTITPVK
jgi:hypothetical protein